MYQIHRTARASCRYRQRKRCLHDCLQVFCTSSYPSLCLPGLWSRISISIPWQKPIWASLANFSSRRFAMTTCTPWLPGSMSDLASVTNPSTSRLVCRLTSHLLFMHSSSCQVYPLETNCILSGRCAHDLWRWCGHRRSKSRSQSEESARYRCEFESGFWWTGSSFFIFSSPSHSSVRKYPL